MIPVTRSYGQIEKSTILVTFFLGAIISCNRQNLQNSALISKIVQGRFCFIVNYISAIIDFFPVQLRL